MNKHIKIWLPLIFLPLILTAQHEVESVLYQIEKNNTTLSAMRKSVEAEKIGVKTGFFLQNPEVGFNYLWSDPAIVGNRTDINIRQDFDFPTAYGYRKRIAASRNTQADLEYTKLSKNIRREARLLCAELIYLNALLTEYGMRLSQALQLADVYQVMFDKGGVGILEYNKAQVNLLISKQEIDALKVERSACLNQLSAMNGGQPIALDISTFPIRPLPSDFNQWYIQTEQENTELQWLNEEAQLNQHQEKLNRALSLPKASTGYMSENRTGEHFQGVSVGLSIPLWENKNTVKYAKAKTLAYQGVVADNKLQFYNQLKIQYEKALSLQKNVNDYLQTLKLYQQADLLKKALEKGEISLLTYLLEISLSNSAIEKYLKAEYEFYKAVILLYQYQD